MPDSQPSNPDGCPHKSVSSSGHRRGNKLRLIKPAPPVCPAFGDTIWLRRTVSLGASLIAKEPGMANVYVEARPKGRPEGSRIDDYVVEDHADHVLGTFKTQREAIDWAKAQGHHPLVARVRHLNDRKKPDHWRAA